VLQDKIVTYIDVFSPVRYDRKYYYRAYIQENDRSSGLCVLLPCSSPDIPVTGNKLTVTGSLTTFDKETVMVASEWTIDSNTYPLPAPLALPQKFIAGGLDMPSSGLDNVGLRVRVFGKVTAIDMEGMAGIDVGAYIDDGSGLLDHQPLQGQDAVYGLRVRLMGNDYGAYIGDYIAVTGVLGVQLVDIDGTPGYDDAFLHSNSAD
jgi:hypothetical protein